MTIQEMNQAIEIISSTTKVKVSFNVPITDSYANAHQMVIHECSASTINKLVEEGFSLYMTDKGLAVEKF